MKYIHEELNVIRNVIGHTNYAILNIVSDVYPGAKSILVEPYYLNAENKLICFTEELFPESMHQKDFHVTIKCINRKKGNFIRMTGEAKIDHQTTTNNSVVKSVLVIKLLQMAWYYKHTGKVEFYQ